MRDRQERRGLGIVFIAAVLLELVFVGIPYRYRYDLYEYDRTPILDGIQFVFRINETESFLGYKVVTGAPYHVSLQAYGDRNRHVALTLYSLKLVEPSGAETVIISPDEPNRVEFIAHSIWLMQYFSNSPLYPEFIPGGRVRLVIDFTVETKNGPSEYHLDIGYSAKRSSGFGIFPLREIPYIT